MFSLYFLSHVLTILCALLLQAAPTHAYALPSLGTVLLWVIASATALEKIHSWFFGGTKSRLEKFEAALAQFVDKDALEKRFVGIEDKAKLVGAEVANQHNTLHEYERKRTELSGEFRANISQLQDKVHALETMPGRVTSLETKLDNLTAQITDLKTGQRELRNEMREDMKNNKGEILAAIKDLKQHP